MNDSDGSATEEANPKPGRRRALLAWVGIFILVWVGIAQLFLSFPMLYDTDSYYHLSIGRLYAQHGIIDGLPWARFSALHDGFGDKEALFHVTLAPFASGESPEVGGRWALAFWNALVIVVLAAVGRRLAGTWGLSAPLLVYAGSFDFLGRLIRLRPETPALLLFIAAALCVGHRRYRLLGVVAFVFTLSYTAFHALLGLCLLWFLQTAWTRGRIRPEMLVYPLLGASSALLLHPHFPHNLLIWKIQSLDFFQYKDMLDVGSEIRAEATDVVLGYNLPWLVAIAALWLAGGRGGRLFAHDGSWGSWTSAAPGVAGGREGSSQADPVLEETRDALVLGALVFGVLYLLMLRFSTHFLPFATLAVLATVGRPSSWIPLPGRGRIPLVLVVVLAMGVGGWRAGELLANLADEPEKGAREQEWHAFSRAVPPGAKVAAWWGDTQTFMFFAPQATYLNVLDPVFMAVPYPEAYAAQRAIFDGVEPDVPFTLVAALDSDFLAASRSHREPTLFERLRHDPRIGPRYQGGTLLFQVRPGNNRRFMLDWRQVPRGLGLPVAPDQPTDGWTVYPLEDNTVMRAMEGYVDATRLTDEPCTALVHDLDVSEEGAGARRWELAPFGPTTVWLDNETVFSSQATLGAYLGRGLRSTVELTPGRHRITALTCRGEVIGEGPAPYNGFYLIDRTPDGTDSAG